MKNNCKDTNHLPLSYRRAAAGMGEECGYFGDGFSSKHIFEESKTCQAYTFDDLILMPGSAEAAC